MRGAASAVLALAVLATGAGAADEVGRRGAESTLVGTVSVIDDAGVTINATVGTGIVTDHFVPWDRVRTVVTERAWPGLAARLEVAEDLWRARSRLQRGDHALAEPLFERLFERHRGQTHATAHLVAEGLVRCRIARGAHELAMIPALEVIRLERAGMKTERYPRPPAVDDAYQLCPALAPAWVTGRAVGRLERDLKAFDAGGDPVVRDLVALYAWAAAGQATPDGSDGTAAAEALADAAHPGVRLLARIVTCGDPDPRRRASARARLEQDLPSLPPWAEGWARFALGSSLAREPDIRSRRRGIVSLLHLPARLRGPLPYLTALALARASVPSRSQGDDAAAAVLRDELDRSFPDHPVRAALTRTRPLPPGETNR